MGVIMSIVGLILAVMMIIIVKQDILIDDLEYELETKSLTDSNQSDFSLSSNNEKLT